MTEYRHICQPGCACMGNEPEITQEVPIVEAERVVEEHLARCEKIITECWMCSTEFALVPHTHPVTT